MALRIFLQLQQGSQGSDNESTTIVDYQAEASSLDPYGWLRPSDLPNDVSLRLMSFGRVTEAGNDFQDERLNLSGKGLQLLEELERVRRDESTKRRTLVFICYSFGGHVVKDALLIAESHPKFCQIYENCRGIIFLGVINTHQHPKLEKHIANCIATELSLSQGDRRLRPKSLVDFYTQFQDTCKQFCELYTNLQIVTMFETGKTTVAKTFGVVQRSNVLVTHDLAMQRHRRQQQPIMVGEEIDHLNMSLFPVPSSSHAKKVLEVFKELLFSILRNNTIPATPMRKTFIPINTRVSTMEVSTRTASPKPNSGSNIEELLPQSDSSSQISITEPQLPCRMIRPYQRNDKFVGRAETISKISKILDPREDQNRQQSTFALTGLGGVGKTQTALAYVFGSWGKFQAILWAQADKPTKMAQSFADFASDMQLVDDQADQAQALVKVKKWFETAKVPWLVVFDNADRSVEETHDNLELLEEYWPVGDYGSILITSQDKRVGATFTTNSIQLDRLSQENAVALLYRGSSQQRSEANDEDAKEIVERVDRLAFAIDQAAFMIYTKPLSFSEYLLIYDNRRLIEESRPIRSPVLRYRHSLSTIWALAFQDLHGGAALLMDIIAFLDPDEIKEDILFEGATKSLDPSLAFLRGKSHFVQCRASLTSCPLVYWNANLKVLWIHRLVQEICHLRMDPETRQANFERAYRMLYAVWPQMEWHNRRQHKIWGEQQKKIHHIVRLAELYRSSLSSNDPEQPFQELQASAMFAELLYHAAWYYVERGFLSSAEPLLDIAKELCETKLSDPELILADIHGGYGAIDSERNKLRENLEDFQRQYDYLMAALEKGLWKRPHVREALALGGLAQGYAGLDMLEKAEEYYHKCIEAWKEVPGEPTIYQSHLGTCLCYLGKLDQAQDVLETTIHDREVKFGPCDTTSYRTALLYFALGNVRRRQTRYDEAFEIHKSCLLMYKETSGEKHHYTADAYYKVGWHLQYRGDYRAAVEIYNTALSIYNKNPEYNNEIARTTYMLGMAYVEMGLKLEGETLIVEAEELRKSIMAAGWDGPSTGEESYDALVNFWSR